MTTSFDIQKIFEEIDVTRKAEYEEKALQTLGTLTGALEAFDQDHRIYVATGGVLYSVTGMYSYRGYYEDLALELEYRPLNKETAWSLHTLRDKLQEADGKSFFGYKGGSYVMDASTPLWASFNSDDYLGIAFGELMVIDDFVVITTQNIE